jgi:hypothetical protein
VSEQSNDHTITPTLDRVTGAVWITKRELAQIELHGDLLFLDGTPTHTKEGFVLWLPTLLDERNKVRVSVRREGVIASTSLSHHIHPCMRADRNGREGGHPGRERGRSDLDPPRSQILD